MNKTVKLPLYLVFPNPSYPGFSLKLLFLLCIHLFPFLVCSQQQRLEPEKWEWWPIPMKYVDYSKGTFYGYPRSVQAIFYQNMARLMELVHQTPFLNPPHGFSVRASAVNCPTGCDKGLPLRGKAGFIIKAYHYRGSDPTLKLDAEGPALHFYCNDIGILFTDIGINEGDYFFEPRIEQVNGRQVYNDKYVVITKNKASLFTYITKKEWLGMTIAQKETRMGALKKQLAEPTPYGLWLADKERRNKSAEETHQWLAKTDPAKATAAREKHRKFMADTEEKLKAGEPQYVRERQRVLNETIAEWEAAKAQLANMDVATQQEAAQTPQGKKLVRLNRNFYNPSLPPHAIQLIVVDLYQYRGSGLKGTLAREAMKVIQETIDLKSLEAAMP